jgi:hypothetical protein
MNVVTIARRPRGKGLRSKKAKQRKQQHRPVHTPIALPADPFSGRR